MKTLYGFDLAKHFLLHKRSPARSVTLTALMLAAFFISYAAAAGIYWAVATRFSYILMEKKYFPIFFCIASLPAFGFLFFKLNIWIEFWGKTEKLHPVDFIFFGVIILFLYFSFNHVDIIITSTHGKGLLDMVISGTDIRSFYDYSFNSRSLFPSIRRSYESHYAAYLLPQYILFAIWSLPVNIIHFLAGKTGLNSEVTGGITLCWYKLLPTLFYLGCGFMVYKIGTLLQMCRDKARWMLFVFLTFPMATYSQFILSQYDSTGLFFELLMVYFCKGSQ